MANETVTSIKYRTVVLHIPTLHKNWMQGDCPKARSCRIVNKSLWGCDDVIKNNGCYMVHKAGTKPKECVICAEESTAPCI